MTVAELMAILGTHNPKADVIFKLTVGEHGGWRGCDLLKPEHFKADTYLEELGSFLVGPPTLIVDLGDELKKAVEERLFRLHY